MITACGSAVYAGSMSKYVIEELCRIPVEADLASELRYRNPLVDEHTLLVVVSQSGETADAIAAMKECKARSARVLAIENVLGSTIAKLADDAVYTWAGPEIVPLQLFDYYVAKANGCSIDKPKNLAKSVTVE